MINQYVKHFFFLLLFLMCYFLASAQDTIYYDKDNKKVATLAAADHYAVILRDSSHSNRVTETLYSLTDGITGVTHYSDYLNHIREGLAEEYYKSGQLHVQINYAGDRPEGELKTFWETGRPKRDDFYHQGALVRGKCFDSSGKSIPHFDFWQLPSFRGGQDSLTSYLMHSLRYPKRSRRLGIWGKVIVQFCVEKDGSIDRVTVIRHATKILDAEAVRVISTMPPWTPGAEDGEPVTVQYSIPINFAIEDDPNRRAKIHYF